MLTQTAIQSMILDQGLTFCGVAPLQRPVSMDLYKDWIVQGRHGDMGYLKDHEPLKEDPQSYAPQARSAIVVAQNYVPHPAPTALPLSGTGIAKYARGRDYHHFLRERLENVIARLRQQFPSEFFMAATDSSPVLERDLAQRAGLGWIGRNSCLIDRKQGSFFLLGEILTSLELQPWGDLSQDFCGNCRRCVESCPTQALRGDRTMDARLCISYWTIESAEVPPVELREKFSGWLFGCDICQDVCPWNQKPFASVLKAQHQAMSDSEAEGVTKEVMASHRAQLIEDLRWVLSTSHKQLQKTFQGTALARAAGPKLKRNAFIVIANRRVVELKDLVATFIGHERFNELARWTLSELSKAQKQT